MTFSQSEGLLEPKHVAYTIFPQGLYIGKNNATDLFNSYNRHNGLFERLQHRKPNWGTYFRRMTHYESDKKSVNQLDNIITALNSRKSICKAAYTIVIQKPGGETKRIMGGPCLNYIAIQVEPKKPVSVGLLAVYRNHDFLRRAYGNYWGLCNLLKFLANEVKADLGPLTCISSRAYIMEKKVALKSFVEGF